MLLLATAVLAVASLFIGVSQVTLGSLLAGGDGQALQVMLISRVPRTLALMLAGMSMAIAGLIMQMIVRNRFVEPSTAGTVESATLGMLAVTLLAPGLPVFGKMLVAAAFALAGTGLFLRILRQVPARSALVVPLVGLVLGGVIEAAATFLAYQYDLMQALRAWTLGDFSGVLRGRYELLWLSFALAVAAYLAADRFTVAGMGRDATVNLGLDYGKLVAAGLVIVALITAAVLVTAGTIPFLGLVVPNVVSLLLGDNARRTIPWIALVGAVFALACDMIGRAVIHPYEIPIGTVVGIVGSVLFLYLLLRGRARGG